MVPLRVYVGDDNNLIYDVRGVREIGDFNLSVISRQVEVRTPAKFRFRGVATRTYDEEGLKALPINFQADEMLIAKSSRAITANSLFLDRVKPRPEPTLPAKFAADFSFGLCAIYAQALEDLADVKASAMLAEKRHTNWAAQAGKDGYFHSLAVLSDGIGEDSWGRQPLEVIAERFGVVKWRIDRSSHLDAVNNLRKNSPKEFARHYERAAEAITRYRHH